MQDPAPSAGTSASAPEDPRIARVLERLAQLPQPEQEAVAERVRQAILAGEHPLLAAAAALEAQVAGQEIPILEPDPARAYDATEYAPALKLRSRVLPPRSTWWRRLQRRLFGRQAPELTGARWRYEPGRNALLRPQSGPAAGERIRAWLEGRWAEADRLQALAEAILDDAPELDAAADYFAHHYRDREGRIYSGLRLYDVWGSGQEFGISDVEAIAWLRLVAGEKGPRSPIPPRLHEGIYARIRDSFRAYRDWRELRRALAARMLDPAGEPPPTYRGIIKELDEAWALVGHDPARLRELLADTRDRRSFFQAVKTARRSADARALQAALELRRSLPGAIAAAAWQAIGNEGLAGVGRRWSVRR